MEQTRRVEERVQECGKDSIKSLPIRIVSGEKVKKIKKSKGSHQANKIKVVDAGHSNERDQLKFEQELSQMLTKKHRLFANIKSADKEHDKYFIVQEEFQGQNLIEKQLSQTEMSEFGISRMVAQMLETVVKLEKLGLKH